METLTWCDLTWEGRHSGTLLGNRVLADVVS